MKITHILESRNYLYEGLDASSLRSIKLWESAGRKLVEYQMTPDQISQLFAQVQQNATAAGSNRTMIGKGKDAADAVGKAWEDLKGKVQNSGPIKNVDAAYDQAAAKLKQATGGDAGVMKYVEKYRKFAKEHPVAQSLIYAALIAAAGISAAAAGGSAASASSSSAAARKQNEDIMKAIYTGSHQEMTPYRKLGKQAAAGYQAGMPGWADTAQYQQYMQPYTQEQYRQSPLYTPMVNSLAELQATPGYQFQLQQGQQNLAQQAAARGGLLSGAQLKAAQGYGQQQAATGFQQAWQRAQDAYSKAFGQNLAQQQQYGSLLMGANQQAANIYNTGTQTGLNAALGLGQIGAGALTGAMASNTAAGQAQGQSYLGMGAGIGQGIGGVYNAGKNNGLWGQGATPDTGYMSPGGKGAIF